MKVEAMPKSLTVSDDPFRSVDWRWQVARQPLRPSPHARRKTACVSTQETGDEWVTAARNILNGGRTALHRPEIKGAIAFHESGGWRRWEVDALLLTKLSFSDIGKRCRIAAQTVEAYHAIFFDVRDRLDDQEWINSRVLGRGGDGTRDDCGHGEIWKRVAHDHGVPMLDMYMAVTLNRQLPEKFIASLGPNHKHKAAYARLQIMGSIARQRARTDEQHGEVSAFEQRLKKLHIMIYGDESPADRAARMIDEVLLHNSKLFKTTIRRAKREKANT